MIFVSAENTTPETQNSESETSTQSDTTNTTEMRESDSNQNSESTTSTLRDSFTLAEIAEFDGKNGNLCYVAISGVVYDMSTADNWSNGTHTSSGGRANCGEDLTNVISSSPHGRSVLSDSKVKNIGNLQN